MLNAANAKLLPSGDQLAGDPKKQQVTGGPTTLGSLPSRVSRSAPNRPLGFRSKTSSEWLSGE
jgi:hypothetical protein